MMEIHSRLSFIALYLTHIGGPCHLVNHLTKLISMNIEYPQVPTSTDHLCLCVIGAKFSSGPKELKSVNSRLQIRRRRRGSTSLPLVCIEPNPGPKSKARRWRPKEARNWFPSQPWTVWTDCGYAKPTGTVRNTRKKGWLQCQGCQAKRQAVGSRW